MGDFLGRRPGRSLIALVRDEDGQAITEYILILSFTVAGAVALSRAILAGLKKGILILGAQLERSLKTGRAEPSVWAN